MYNPMCKYLKSENIKLYVYIVVVGSCYVSLCAGSKSLSSQNSHYVSSVLLY